VIVEVLAVDGENDADIPGQIGVAAAIAISDVPFQANLAAARVARVDNEWVANPTFEQRDKSDLDLVVAATKEKVIMLEAQSKQVKAAEIDEAIRFGKKHIKQTIDFIEGIQKKIGKEKIEVKEDEISEDIKQDVANLCKDKLEKILYDGPTRIRKREVYHLGDEVAEELVKKHGEEQEKAIKHQCTVFAEEVVRDNILDNDKRIGGRKLDEIRQLSAKVGIIPRVHGTGLFQRGGTQVLTITTLGAPGDKQIIENSEEEYKKGYMHHYNFLPFSVAEMQPLRGPSRRDIGHGMLAEKALEPVLPKEEDFPYTIRLVSEVYSSNGSSSMASVCGSSLSLMDSGIPIKEQVAGVAMGLASRSDTDYKVITDLQDLEDSEGGMDFKVAGTKNGFTAIQMDTKTLGITDSMVSDTLTQGNKAVLEIIDVMNKTISEPRAEMSPYAPRIYTLKIDPEKIRSVIGPGGKVINKIIEETGVEIDIEDDGTVMVSSSDEQSANKALDQIKDLTKEAKVGDTYTGKVVKIMNFGAFVELFPGTEGMIHISKLAPHRVNKVEDVVKTGQIVKVKVIEIDSEGRVNLTLIQDDQR